jgi:hypothetical protein
MKKTFTLAFFLISGLIAIAQDRECHINYQGRDDRKPDEEYPSKAIHEGGVNLDGAQNNPVAADEEDDDDKKTASTAGSKIVVIYKDKNYGRRP